MELHDPGGERMTEGGDFARLRQVCDQHSEYRRRQTLEDHRRLFLGEILAVNREPQWKSQIANAALLKHFRLSSIDHAGNLDQILFEHDQLCTPSWLATSKFPSTVRPEQARGEKRSFALRSNSSPAPGLISRLALSAH